MPTPVGAKWGLLGGGNELYDIIMSQIKNGLSPDFKNMLTQQAGGQQRGAEQQIRESFAGSGAPIGTQIGAQIASRSNINKNLLDTLTQGDLQAKQQGFGNFANVEGLHQGALNSDRDLFKFNKQLQAQQDSGGFDWGQFAGDLIKSGATVGASACCFIFMEAYNGDMPYWVRECRDEFAPENTERRTGYIKMSKWLVPLMRKNRIIRYAVNELMIKPLTKWGGWYKKVKGFEKGFIYKPFVKFWFKVWQISGTAY